MKYKLLQDMPSGDRNDIYEKQRNGRWLNLRTLCYHAATDEYLNAEKPNDEWFEKVEDDLRWRAKYLDNYFAVALTGEARKMQEDNVPVDDKCYKIGNYFETKKEADLVAEAFVAMLAYINSAHNGGKKTTELHNEFIKMTQLAGKAHKEVN